MSLKAKIEAVIYAAEEPVTLAQLAGLFADESLEEKRARDAAAQTVIEPANEVSVVLTTESLEPDDGVFPAGLISEEHSAPLTVEEAAVMASQDSEEDVVTIVEVAVEPEAAAGPSAPSPDDEKRAARQRDREMREELRRVVSELVADYADSDRGMEIREIAGGYRMATKPQFHEAVRGFIKSLKPALKLSLPALETLTIIAYKQPITAPEIGEIRGVDVSGVLGGLLSRKLISTAGRKQVLGRPILYKTTREFLLRFGLKDLSELTSLEEFEQMATEMTEFDDAPASPEQMELEKTALAEAEMAEPEILAGEDSATTADGLPEAATKGLA